MLCSSHFTTRASSCIQKGAENNTSTGMSPKPVTCSMLNQQIMLRQTWVCMWHQPQQPEMAPSSGVHWTRFMTVRNQIFVTSNHDMCDPKSPCAHKNQDARCQESRSSVGGPNPVLSCGLSGEGACRHHTVHTKPLMGNNKFNQMVRMHFTGADYLLHILLVVLVSLHSLYDSCLDIYRKSRTAAENYRFVL